MSRYGIRTSLAVSLAAVCLSGLAIAADVPRVPVPAGFVEASGLSDAVRSAGVAGLTASAKLLGVYYTTNAVAEILSSGFAAPSPFCKAILEKEFRSTDEARKEFRTLVANAKKESERRFDPDDPQVRTVLKQYEDASRNIVPGVSVKAAGTSVLGTIIEDNDTFAISVLVIFAWSDQQAQAHLPFAVAHAWTLQGNSLVKYSVAWPFTDASHVTRANQGLLAWLGRSKEAKQSLPTLTEEQRTRLRPSKEVYRPYSSITEEEKRQLLLSKGLSPDEYYFDPLTSAAYRRSPAERRGNEVATEPNITTPPGAKCVITVIEGEQISTYLSTDEPKPLGVGFKFKLFPTDVEMIVSGHVTVYCFGK